MKRLPPFYALIVVVIGIVLGAYFYKQRQEKAQSTITNDWEASFAVRDTSNITKIFIVNKAGKRNTLTKIGPARWLINDKYEAHQGIVQTLLETIRNVEVQRPIGKNEQETIVKDLAANHNKVEIYLENRLFKTYYVGGHTLDQTGTYMLLEGASKPYVTHIPNFEGFLNVRYQIDEKIWRTPKIIPFPSNEIQQISIAYPKAEKENFTISKSGIDFLLNNSKVDQGKILFYIKQFDNFFVENYLWNASQGFKDTISQEIPFCEISIKGKEAEKSITLTVYSPKDEDRFLAYWKEEALFVSLQQTSLSKFLKRKQDLQ